MRLLFYLHHEVINMNYDTGTVTLLELIFTFNSFRISIEMLDFKSMALRIYSFTSNVKKKTRYV